MPVTIRPSSTTAESWGNGEQSPELDAKFTHATSADQLLSSTTSNDGDKQYGYETEVRRGRGRGPVLPNSHNRGDSSAPRNKRPHPQLIQTSFTSLNRTSSTIFAAKNGFVHACIEAYNEHHNLVLRPEDIWFAILTQLSAYVNAHADELQSQLINPPSTSGQQKQPLHIETNLADPALDHGSIAYQMTQLMANNLLDPTLRDWILPSFSTTDKTDQAVASILFMGTLQKYFSYSWGTRCGIPSATLLGEMDDWIEIAQRCASHLATGRFGPGPAVWYSKVLRPILGGFVESFRDPGGRTAGQFWRGVVDRFVPDGSGKVTYSGWITGFCYWDESGRCLHGGGGVVELSRGEVPVGFVKVPVVLLDGGVSIDTEMVAGSVGIRVLKGGGVKGVERGETGDQGRGQSAVVVGNGEYGVGGVVSSSSPTFSGQSPVYGSGIDAGGHRWEGYDTIQPESGWFMYRV